MVALPRVVDVEKEAGSSGAAVIPAAQYQACILSSEVKPTKSGDGKFVEMLVSITHGDYASTEFTERLNIINNNPQAERIAYQTIANIGKAIGLTAVNSTDQLHNNPIMIEVKNVTSKDWIDKDGKTVKGTEKSEIKKYLALPSSGVPSKAAPTDSAAPADTPASEPEDNPFAMPA